jgi:F0F1-type ATP synthase delta subunit
MTKLSDLLADVIMSRLSEADSLEELPPLIAKLQAAADRHALHTRVISAVELSEQQRSELHEGLSVDEIDFVVDPAILGGLILEHEGRRTDLSWRRRVSQQHE